MAGINARKGQCPRGQNPPCGGPSAALYRSDHGLSAIDGHLHHGGAFVPTAAWPMAFEGGYLFADGGSGRMWLRTATGGVDYNAPFATGLFGITDMTFVDEASGTSPHYMLNRTRSGPQDHRATSDRCACRVHDQDQRDTERDRRRVDRCHQHGGRRLCPGSAIVPTLPVRIRTSMSTWSARRSPNLAIVGLDGNGRGCIFNQSADRSGCRPAG